MRILHLIPSLNVGGAERVLSTIVLHNPEAHIVLCFRDIGVFGERLKRGGVQVISLELKHRYQVIFKIRKILQLAKGNEATILQCWMFHANLLGSVIKLFNGPDKLLWNIRIAHVPVEMGKISRSFIMWLCRVLAKRSPDKILFCGPATMDYYLAQGYPVDKCVAIPNGFSKKNISLIYSRNTIQRFRIGMAARVDPQKDHLTLLRAIALVKDDCHVTCVLVGAGLTDSGLIREEIARLGLRETVVLIDNIDDMDVFYSSLDLHVLSTFGEGFPNVVGESMRIGVVTVASEVADAPTMLKCSAHLFEAGNAVELASKIRVFYELSSYQDEWQILRNRMMETINHHFSEEKMVMSYYKQWASLK